MEYKIIVDKQSKINPSNEKKEYVLEIEELRSKGDIYDSLIITKDEDYVIRRLALNEYNVLKVLSEPIKETLDSINIELFEGDNYIYLLDMQGNEICAEYTVKNEFTDMYVTVNEMNSSINQTAGELELSVNQKLTEYATNNELESKVIELNSKIVQKADEITQTVSKKVGEDELCSKISQSAEEIQLKGNRIIIDSDKFKVTKEGNITATGGIIGGFDLKETEFTSNVNGIYNYDYYDLRMIQAIIVGTLRETNSHLKILDTDNDGRLKATDYARIQNIIKGNLTNTKKVSGTFKINAQDPKNCMSVYQNGELAVSLGVGGVNASNVTTENIFCGYMEQDSEASLVGIGIDGRNREITFVNGYNSSGSISSDGMSVEIRVKDYLKVLNGSEQELIAFGNNGIYPHRTIDMQGDNIINAGNVSSDRRLKKEIKLSRICAVDRIKQIKHKEFIWKKNNEKEEIGYIAQELEKIDKNYVRHNITKDEKGNIMSDNYEVRILPLLSTATKAIQEQQRTIEKLEKEVKELRRKVR